MNELEKKYNLVDKTLEEVLKENPLLINLKFVPKIKQTQDILFKVCEKDGLQLKYASKKLISFELCEVAVKQNGRALEFVPEKIIQEKGEEWFTQLCKDAVLSNGMAIEYVPFMIKDEEMVKISVLEHNGCVEDREYDYYEYPIKYALKSVMTEDFLIQMLYTSPFALKNIPRYKITENIVRTAISQNGNTIRYVPDKMINEELVSLAISSNEMSIQFIPERYKTEEICHQCLNKNYMVLPYIPEKYITEKMCINLIKESKCVVDRISKDKMIELYGTEEIKLLYLKDLPEKIRNNKKVLDAFVEMNEYGSLPIIKWNEKIVDNLHDRYRIKDVYGNDINPLEKNTVEYLSKLIKEPKNELIIDKKYDNILDFVSNYDLNEYIKVSDLSVDRKNIEDYVIVPYKENSILNYDLSNEDHVINIYYISDIHLKHQLIYELKKYSSMSKELLMCNIKRIIEERIDELITDVQDDEHSLLLIGGDVADDIGLSAVFYQILYEKWNRKDVISVLGNHELWDGTYIKEWENDDYKPRRIEEIVKEYREHIEDKCSHFLLENELYFKYKNGFSYKLSEKDLINSSEEDLTDLLSKCTLIVLGGLAYSAANDVYNYSYGLYRKAITSFEEEKYRTDRFRKVYDKVEKCASDRKVIVLTHTPTYDWLNRKCNNNWIYINGHTHQNSISIKKDGAVIFSDNQIGYEPKKWKLKSFSIDFNWYDPFEKYENGIYNITSEQYVEFNLCRGIDSRGCNYPGKLFMLKKNKTYMFVLESKSGSLCIMEGGRRKLLSFQDKKYYYDNMDKYCNNVNMIIEPYKRLMKELSKEIQRFGGNGTIHGCIVDISFFSHVYVNPYDRKITPYWAMDIMSRLTFDNVESLLEKKEPELLKAFMIENEKQTIPLLSKESINDELNQNLEMIPKWMFGTEVYDPSRIMKKIQYVWENNVIRIWEENVLKYKNNDENKRIIKDECM
ncbi:MAG: DUF4116 domain-containing protein [Lachnospiraceae bacterium]|nr:DUF4116 domain-containing protein [Lachnospiraceae bacterium]